MVFSSNTFLFLFLPFVLVIYFNPFVRSRKFKNAFLFLASLVFYAWGEPVYWVLMLLSIFVNWIFGMEISKKDDKRRIKRIEILAIIYNLFFLFVFKYLNFTLQNIKHLTGISFPMHKFALPIGISFYTFQTMSYTLDVYNEKATVQKNPLKEEKTAADLEQASEKLNKLTDRDVRIVYLPPMTVASIHIVGQDADGEHAEYTSAVILDEFIEKTNLKMIYPSARNFGFNNPDGISDDNPNHGYERWISIPDDMEVPAPLVKKHLDGGLYAAHMIPMGAWDEGWMPLYNWVDENNNRYVGRWSTIDGVCGWLEEHLNYWDWNDTYDGKAVNQVDLLMPIKPRFAAGTRHSQERIVETFNYNGIPEG